ncbi:MAG: methyltransferase domain-containing protein [Caulobacteraceae bacterium]|nr:methyltransferase domain-containing protein [Caulobacteraceae bacterium]
MSVSSACQRADVWTDAAMAYEALAEPVTRQFAVEALRLGGGVTPGERVLDVATGTGALALEAAAGGGSVLATDFSPGMVNRVAFRFAEGGFGPSGCEARVMDGQALQLCDSVFNAAFSLFGVMLFPDWRQGLRELHRVVRPGGRVVVATWADPRGAGPAILFDSVWRETFPGRAYPPHPEGLGVLSDPDRLRVEMTEAGSAEVTVFAFERDWEIASANWLADNADRIFQQFQGWVALDPSERGTLRGRLRLSRGEVADQPFNVPSRALIAVGQLPRKMSDCPL